jgi:hypothetical protein
VDGFQWQTNAMWENLSTSRFEKSEYGNGRAKFKLFNDIIERLHPAEHVRCQNNQKSVSCQTVFVQKIKRLTARASASAAQSRATSSTPWGTYSSALSTPTRLSSTSTNSWTGLPHQ